MKDDRAHHGWRGRTAWALASQVLSSSINFVLGILMAHTLAPSDFGQFAIAAALYVGGVQAVRVVASAPLVILRSTGPDHSRHLAATVQSVLVAALAAGASIAAGALVLGAPGAVVAIGVAFPLLLVHEVARQEYLGAGNARRATTYDAVWAGTFLTLLLVSAALGVPTATVIASCWGVSVAASVILFVTRSSLRLPAARLPPQHRKFNRHMAVEYGATYFGAQGLVLLLPVTVGLAATGEFRAASQNILGMPMVAVMGLIPQLTYEFRNRASDPFQLKRLSKMSTLTICGGLTATVAAAYVMPDTLGHLLAGTLWPTSRPMLLGAGALTVGATWVTLRIVPLRFGVAANVILRLRITLAFLPIALPLVAGFYWSRHGLIAGCILAGVGSVVITEVLGMRLWTRYKFGAVT